MTSVSESTRLLEEMLLCPLCLCPFQEPRSLRCLHTFCTECLIAIHSLDLINIECPVCRDEQTHAPSIAHIRSLPLDYRIDQMKDYVTAVNTKYFEENACDVCKSLNDTSSATQHCLQCRIHICDDCHFLHNGNPLFADHDVIALLADVGSTSAMTSSPFCASHRKQIVRYFCTECAVTLCTLCAVMHDSSHQCDTIERDVVKKAHRSGGSGGSQEHTGVATSTVVQTSPKTSKRPASVLDDTSSDATNSKHGRHRSP